MNTGGGGDHDVFEQPLRLALHKTCPLAEAASVQGQDLEGLRKSVHPEFDLVRFRRVLVAGESTPVCSSLMVTAER